MDNSHKGKYPQGIIYTNPKLDTTYINYTLWEFGLVGNYLGKTPSNFCQQTLLLLSKPYFRLLIFWQYDFVKIFSSSNIIIRIIQIIP